jgi:hypothetical protein
MTDLDALLVDHPIAPPSLATPPARVWMAVLTTWSWRVLRGGELMMTGYRTGAKVGCARDVNGWKLYARSATKCALLGWSAARILTAYYAGRLVR